MKFELSDDVLLKVSSAAVAAQGAGSLLAPRDKHNLLMKAGEPYSDVAAREAGFFLAANAAQGWSVSMSDDRATKKDLLKVHGAAWLISSAMTAYHLSDNRLKPEPAYAFMATGAVLGGLCLWKGFEDNGLKLD